MLTGIFLRAFFDPLPRTSFALAAHVLRKKNNLLSPFFVIFYVRLFALAVFLDVVSASSLRRVIIRPLLGLLKENKVVSHNVADVQVYNPVHQIEADKTNRKDDARVLVDVRWRYACKR